MLMEENSPRLRQEFHEKKREVSDLRSQLNAVHTEKEELYRQLKSVHDTIKQNSAQIKVLKLERDTFTKQVKTLKDERQKQHQSVKEKADQKLKVEEKKKSLHKEFSFRESPGQLKSQIERLEMKIVTDALPFEKEQQLNKVIKELKAKLKQMQQLIVAGQEMNTISADVASGRRTAQDLHEQVQKTAQQGQEKHEKINEFYSVLKESRAQEKTLAERYLQLKNQYYDLKKKLEEVLVRYTELSRMFKQEEEKSFTMKVKEKTAEIQEKIKKGKKLSTEDILAFQAMKE